MFNFIEIMSKKKNKIVYKDNKKLICYTNTFYRMSIGNLKLNIFNGFEKNKLFSRKKLIALLWF